MAGSNQLVIGVGANTDKLRADLALAQADVTAFGKELRTAAAEARDTGDYTKVQQLAGKYEDARKSALGLNQEIRNAKGAADDSGGSGGWLAGMTAAWGRMRSAMTPVMEEAKGHFQELHAAATKFGSALSNTASSIFPHFKEVLGLATIGGAAGFLAMVERTAEWAHNIELTSQRLGLSITQIGSLSKAAKDVGIEFDRVVEAAARIGVNLEKAANEQKKVGIDLGTRLGGSEPLAAGGATVFRGGLNSPAGESIAKQLNPASQSLGQFKDDITALYNLLDKSGAAPAASLEAFMTKITNSLAQGGKEAEKTRQSLAKVGIDLPALTRGELLERAADGFTDSFTKMGIKVLKTSGDVRSLFDVLGDFAEKIKNTSSETERLKLVSDQLGKRYTDLVPYFAQGRDGLEGLITAMKSAGINTSEFEKEVGKGNQLFIKLNQFKTAISSLQRSFVLPFADVFTPMVEGLDKALKGNKERVAEFARGIAATLRPIADDIGRLFKGEAPTKGGYVEYFLGLKQRASDALTFIQNAFEKLMGTLDKIASAINSVFGTNFNGKTLLVTLAIGKLIGGFTLLTTGIKAVSAALALIYLNPVTIAIAAIVAGAVLIYANWDKIGPLFEDIWNIIQKVGTYIAGGFVAAWNAAAEGIKTAWSGLTTWISGQIDQILGVIDKVVKAAQAVADTIKSLGGASAAPSAGTGGGYSSSAAAPAGTGGTQAYKPEYKDFDPLAGVSGGAAIYASGGYIKGPGSSTSDSILSRLSNGEFVMRAGAVSKLGIGFLNHLNSVGYAMGGPVGGYSPSLPSFAGGGPVGGGGSYGTLNLTIGGQTANLHVANRSGYDDVVRASRSEQRTSAGAKPQWYES